MELPAFTEMSVWLYAAAIPYFFLAMGIEARHIYKSNNNSFAGYHWKDSLTSIGMGLQNLLTTGLSLVLVVPIAYWIYDHRLLDFNSATLGAVLGLIVLEDFVYYWYHRVAHRMNLFWAEHTNHHCSPTYNLSTALRQSMLAPFYAFWFWMPLVWLGFDPLAIGFVHAINLLYQFWIHTETFRIGGWFEKIFNCPQHHRLHHAKNEQYLDCNYAGIFIIWDRMFGSYREEIEGVKMEFGTVVPMIAYNPVKVGLWGWKNLLANMRGETSLRGKLRWLVKPPEWTPAGQGAVAASDSQQPERPAV